MPSYSDPPTERASSLQNAGFNNEQESTEVPARYAREIRAREQLHDRCPVDVYVAGINNRYSWPYRLIAANRARPSISDTSATVIVDSVVNDPYYPVEDILDAAHRLDADYVIGKDWPKEAHPAGDGIHPADAYDHFISKSKRHPCDAEVIVPLIPPFDAQMVGHFSDVDHYALGGMRDFSPERQVTLIKQFRENAGYDVNVHGLGVGTSIEVINAIRESVSEDPQRPLLDSFDISTPETAVCNNKIPTKRWQQQRVPLPTGDDSTTVRAGFSEAIARMLEYELTPGCDDEMFETAEFATLF